MSFTPHVLTDQPYKIITDGSYIAIDTALVANRGELLYEKIWQGRQWAVTEYGIEARDGTYTIAAERLPETREFRGQRLPFWPLHMAEKSWVDIRDFCTAFLAALACYPEFAEFNGEQIREGARRALIVGDNVQTSSRSDKGTHEHG